MGMAPMIGKYRFIREDFMNKFKGNTYMWQINELPVTPQHLILLGFLGTDMSFTGFNV